MSAADILRLLRSEFAVDFDLDRQTVAIPAGDVWRIEAGHRLAFDDEVLQRFVERVPEMDVAVGVWRAVVQDVLRLPGARFANLPVDIPSASARAI